MLQNINCRVYTKLSQAAVVVVGSHESTLTPARSMMMIWPDIPNLALSVTTVQQALYCWSHNVKGTSQTGLKCQWVWHQSIHNEDKWTVEPGSLLASSSFRPMRDIVCHCEDIWKPFEPRVLPVWIVQNVSSSQCPRSHSLLSRRPLLAWWWWWCGHPAARPGHVCVWYVCRTEARGVTLLTDHTDPTFGLQSSSCAIAERARFVGEFRLCQDECTFACTFVHTLPDVAITQSGGLSPSEANKWNCVCVCVWFFNKLLLFSILELLSQNVIKNQITPDFSQSTNAVIDQHIRQQCGEYDDTSISWHGPVQPLILASDLSDKAGLVPVSAVSGRCTLQMCSEAFQEPSHPASVPYFHLLRLEKLGWPSFSGKQQHISVAIWLYPIAMLPPALHPWPILLDCRASSEGQRAERAWERTGRWATVQPGDCGASVCLWREVKIDLR